MNETINFSYILKDSKAKSESNLANSIECPALQYYNPYLTCCVNQLLNNQACLETKYCRTDLGLSCQNGKCACNTATQFWNASNCINYYSYNNETCLSSNQCLIPMICNFGTSSCFCPKKVSNATCDCPARTVGNEYFSTGLTCISALSYGNTCSANYTCQYLTQNTYCSGTCSCPTQQYFNTNIKYCINQLTNSDPCSLTTDCRIDLGLSCTAGVCSCNTNTQFWNGNNCTNFLKYNTTTCTADSNCEKSLICKKANSFSCNCPTIVTTGKCDCPVPTINFEYYWNGTYCTSAKYYNESCTANYQCQSLTQFTSCSGSKCDCSSSQYFNFANNKCETLLTINNTCTQVGACDSGMNLFCQSGTCKCNSTQFWESNGCINFFSYNSGTCFSDDQCAVNLICKLAEPSCICPRTVNNGTCDCPYPIYGLEYYWNGTYCATAKSYNQSCTFSYECQALTQATICSAGTCTCDANCWFNSTQCVCCPSGYTLHRSSCFMISSTTLDNHCCNNLCVGANGCSSLQAINSNTLSTYCGNQNTARVAILKDSDATFSSFTSIFATDNYFDAYRNVSGSTAFYSYMTKGYSNSAAGSNAAYWDLTGPAAENCARFKNGAGSLQFKSHKCYEKHNWICEVVIN